MKMVKSSCRKCFSVFEYGWCRGRVRTICDECKERLSGPCKTCSRKVYLTRYRATECESCYQKRRFENPEYRETHRKAAIKCKDAMKSKANSDPDYKEYLRACQLESTHKWIKKKFGRVVRPRERLQLLPEEIRKLRAKSVAEYRRAYNKSSQGRACQKACNQKNKARKREYQRKRQNRLREKAKHDPEAKAYIRFWGRVSQLREFGIPLPESKALAQVTVSILALKDLMKGVSR